MKENKKLKILIMEKVADDDMIVDDELEDCKDDLKQDQLDLQNAK